MTINITEKRVNKKAHGPGFSPTVPAMKNIKHKKCHLIESLNNQKTKFITALWCFFDHNDRWPVSVVFTF